MGNYTSSRITGLSDLDFAGYEAAFKDDLDVRSFDSSLRNQTGKAVAAVAHCVSLDSLKEVTTALTNVDFEAMEVILERTSDVSDKSYFRDLVEEFFNNSQATLEFCTAVESSIKKAKDNQLILQRALSIMAMDRSPSVEQSDRILRLFTLFKQAEDPFGEGFILKFIAVRDRHTHLLEKLNVKYKVLDRKHKKAKLRSKVLSILFGAAVAAILICTVVAAAIAAPPIASALLAVCSLPLSSMGEWVRSICSKYEKEVKDQQDRITRMINQTRVAIHGLEDIRVLVESLEILFKSIISDIDNSVYYEKDAIALEEVVMKITTKRAAFVRELDGLQVYIVHEEHRIRGARTLVTQSLQI